MKKLKKYNYLRILINVIYIIFMMIFGLILATKFPEQLYELDFEQFCLVYSIFVIIFIITFGILYFISIIWHELGHLIFGINAKLKFVSFNVLSYTFFIENNKLSMKKQAKIPGVKGYCNMMTEENKKYNKNHIKLYYMGGIIFNFISIIITAILMIFNDNTYLNLLYILNIGINMYFGLYNLIPGVNKTGVNSDALHLMNYLDDPGYMKTISKLQTLQNLLENGYDLKDIDVKLFSIPQKFNNNSDILNAMIYVDYMSSKDKYKEASEYAKKILEEAKEILSKQDIITLKLQLINCIFYGGDDLTEIAKIWDKDIKKYLDLIGKVSPISIGFNYMYSKLIEKNEITSQKYLNQFNQLKRKKHNEKELKEIEQFINDVNDKVNNS